jgi:uncharacterized coiled-coil protein SlyX
MAKAPVRARTHSDDDEPIIWQLTPENLQKMWDTIFTAAAELASKERKKDLDALQAALGDMQHAVEQMRARVQSLDDRMLRVGNDLAAQRAAVEDLAHGGGVRDGVSAAAESPRRTPLALFEAFLRTCPPERISAGYASWDFDRAMHAIADIWALDPEQLRATLALWREHKLIATDGPDTFRKRLRVGKGRATYPLCVPIASYPLVGIEVPPPPQPHTVSAGSTS